MTDKIIPLIEARKTPGKYVKLDPKGFFVIELDKQQIRVEYYSNVYRKKGIASGKLEKVFIGEKADALSDTIANHVIGLRPEHYCYLGRELQKAESTLKNNKKYIQNGC